MSKSKKEVLILDNSTFKRVISRIASEIIEKNQELDKLVLIGIKKGGSYLKERIKKEIESREKINLYDGDIDITLYRDDIRRIGYNPKIDSTDIAVNLTDKYVVLIDDVLFTGRTVRAAMDVLFDFGRPTRIQLAVMVDRGHRELPIQADFVGKTVPTSKKEIVEVFFEEVHGKDCVILRDNYVKR